MGERNNKLVYEFVNMKNGFTLIELMVVTAIIGLLATFMLANYRAGSQQIREQSSLQAVAQAIRSAQIKALGSEEINCTGPPPNSPCKYGVHFAKDDTRVIVFGDGRNGKAKNNQYDAPEENIEEYELNRRVSITSVSVDGSNHLSVDILFEPPDPEVSFNPSGNTATITITGGRSVTVGRGGSIDIN